MLLAELVREVGGELRAAAVPACRITGVHLDSRRVGAGDLFCALSGTHSDGARFAGEALSRGAAAVLSARALELPGAAAQWLHPDPRRACGEAAALVHGRPAQGLFVTGITGTNGKTTVAHLLGHLLRTAGRRPAVLGTAGNRLADGRQLPATHTTPDAPELMRMLARHRELGGDSLAMEVSSHALDQQRTAGLAFDAAVFTNLSRDHLDYHGDLESYARAKQRLFSALRPSGTAIVNADDGASPRMAAAARAAGASVITYSARQGGDLGASLVRGDLRGTELLLQGMGISRVRLWLPLAGRHNVENALAAAAAALVSGVSPSSVLEGLATACSAPGRLEPVPTLGRGFHLLVDYAHTEDALQRVCRALKESLPVGGRLIVVFGCGGDRDAGKRAPMGRVVSELADLAIVTSDNPRSEDPAAIAAQIVAGMEGPAAREIELDRRRAIALACERARRGDVVLLAGKGHETTQTIGARVLEFDDRQVAAEVLR